MCYLFIYLIYRPKDAIRAVKKRLNGNKNYREVMLTLTVRGVQWEQFSLHLIIPFFFFFSFFGCPVHFDFP